MHTPRLLASLLLPCLLSGLLVLQGCALSGEKRPTAVQAGAGADTDQLILVTFDQAAMPPPPAAGSTRKDTGWSLGYRATVASRRVADELARDYQLTAVDAWPIAALGIHCVVYRVAPDTSRELALSALSADRRVESAQPMQVFGSQSGATATHSTDYRPLQHNLERLQIEPAHRWARGRGVRIAVIDTGVDLAHPELAGRVVEHVDFAGTQREDDFLGDRHGTAMAGVIAGGAAGRMLGIAPAAELLAIKACWPVETGALAATCNSFTLARALSLALSLHSDIINLSLSGPPDPLLERLLRRALDDRVIVVGALAEPVATVQFPASVDGVIAVGNADAAAGRTTALAAPGDDILTLAPQAGYEFQSGSSLAAAQVSGVAALLLERNRRLTANDIGTLLRDSARLADAPSINACKALNALAPEVTCPARPDDH